MPGRFDNFFRDLVRGSALAVLVCGTVLAGGAHAQSLPPGDVYAINAGGSAIDGYGADAYVDTGRTFSNTSQTVNTYNVFNAAPSSVYQDERDGGQFTYTFPNLLPNHSYTVLLHFAELYFNYPGQRRFNVAINNQPVLTDYDIVGTTGSNFRADVETFFARTDANGNILVQFTSGSVDHPAVNAIEIRSRGG